jgi:hypothetical protein
MRFLLACLAAACFPTAMLGAFKAEAAEVLPACAVAGQTFTYDIVRGGNVIGRQTVRFSGVAPDMTVSIDMTASLSVLGVKVYRYEHHGEEHWRNGALASLVTRTDDDGTPRHVNVARDSQTGTWTGTHGVDPGAATLIPTSLWNNRTVTQARLLDRETGEVVLVKVSAEGDEAVHIGSRDVVARKFDLAGLVHGTVWYDAAGCWARALFHTRVDGSLVEIRLLK